MTKQAISEPASPDPSDTTLELRARLAAAEAKIAELDERNLELENDVAYRGVKLSCARIALTRAKIAFDEATRHREQIVQDVAHDLRTPLTSIKGACQNLLDGVAGPLTEDAREYVEIVGEHSERLIDAVNWLLEAMRISNEPLDVQCEEVDVGELTAAAVHSLRPIAADKGLGLHIEAGQAPALVDGLKLRKVVENLVGNALKFTPSGGRVMVTVTHNESNVYLAVRDTGVGMSDDEIGRIFERYYRKPASVAHSSGLGLVICREIVRLHGGEITVQSTPGEGSEFTVRVPRDGEALNAWVSNCG